MPRHRLVHGDRRGQHAGMRVGHRQDLEHALDAAILAVLAVQGVEHDVGAAAAGRAQEIDQRAQVALDVVLDDLWPPSRSPSAQALPLTSETSRSGDQPPIRTATVRSCRLLSDAGGFPTAAAHRSARTRGGALPRPAPRCRPRSRRRVLIRKLQCFSETCASPIARPRQPARSISSHALRPGGLAKVEPPVRLRGWDSARADIDLGDAPRNGELVAGRRPQARRGEDPVRRARAVAIAERPSSAGVTGERTAGAIDGLGRDQHLRELAAVGAGIGREGAADRAGNAAQEFQPGQRMVARRQRHVEIGRAGARHDFVCPRPRCR